MADFYENQMAFAAPTPNKASVARAKNYIAPELEHAAQAIDNAATTKARFDDIMFSENLQTEMTSSIKDIENAKSLDANYDQMGVDALSRFQEKLSSAPESVRNRFLMRNPTALDNYQLAVSKTIADKTNSQIYNKLQDTLPKMSSDVVMGNLSMEDAVRKIQEAGASLSVEQVDNLLNTFRGQYDTYNVTAALANNNWAAARRMLENPEETPTIAADRRAYYMNALKSGIEEEARAKVAKDKKDAEGDSPESLAMLNVHANLVAQNKVADAAKFRDEVLQGLPIKNKDGTIMFRTDNLSAIARNELARKMKTNEGIAPDYDKAATDYRLSFDRLTANHIDDDGAFKFNELTPAELDTATNLYNNNWGFNQLTDAEQKWLKQSIYKIGQATLDTLVPNDQIKDYPFIRREGIFGVRSLSTNPIGNIGKLYQGYSNGTNDSKLSAKIIADVVGDGKSSQFINESQTFTNATKQYVKTWLDGEAPAKGSRGQYILYLGTALLANGSSRRQSLDSAGFFNVPEETFAQTLTSYIGKLQKSDMYAQPATEATKEEDFNNFYKLATGYNNAPNDDVKNNQSALNRLVSTGMLDSDRVSPYNYTEEEQFYPTKTLEEIGRK